MAASLQNQEVSGDTPISDINVTPFVDVVLVLLVIFMVTAPAMMKDVIGINLPKSGANNQKAPASISITVTRQGQFLLNGELMAPEAISAEVKRASERDTNLQGIIAADKEARHGDVVKAIDLIKTAGLTRFAIQIEREN